MYDCDVTGCDDDTVDDKSNDNDDDNVDDCDDDHLWGSHCCAHPTSRFSARREPSLRTAPTTVDGGACRGHGWGEIEGGRRHSQVDMETCSCPGA